MADGVRDHLRNALCCSHVGEHAGFLTGILNPCNLKLQTCDVPSTFVAGCWFGRQPAAEVR